MAGSPGQEYDIYATGADKNLVRGTEDSLDITLPELNSPNATTEDVSSSVGDFSGGLVNPTVGTTAPTDIRSGEMPSLIGFGKKKFTDTIAGYLMGLDNTDNIYKWIVGSSTSSADWAVTTANTFTIVGTITATSGFIGGWTIGATTLTGGDTTLDSTGVITLGTTNNIVKLSSVDATYRIWVGNATAASAPFSVTKAGAIFSTSGTVGGWTLATTTLTGTGVTLSSTGDAYIAFGTTPPTSPTVGTGIFINKTGLFGLSANTQNFKISATDGSITSISGTIGAWNITSTVLRSGVSDAASNVLLDPTNSLLRLGPTSGNYITLDGANLVISSSNYSSGVSGFTIGPTLVEAENIIARGIMKGTTFQYDVISSVGGQVMVTNSDVLASDMTALDSSSLITRGTTTFAVNDILLIRAVTASGIQEEWLRVTVVGSITTYTVTRDLAAAYGANTNPIWQAGTTVVKQGKSDGAATYSGGWLRLIGEGTNSPFYSVFSRTGVAYNSYTERIRLGNLNGFLSETSDVYGIAIGEATKYLKYDATNGLRIAGDVDSLTMTATGFIRGGQTDYATGTGWFIGKSGGDFKLSIGSATNYITWDGTYLRIKGNLDLSSVFTNISYTVANLPIPPSTVGYSPPSAID